MKLISCHIENFGGLSKYDYNFIDGCNQILEDNGWGKSTFAAFLRVMFYGFLNDSKRGKTVKERIFYAPWNGGAFGGQVTYESEGKVYNLTRHFGNKASEDTIDLRYADTNLPVDNVPDNIGESIFKIDVDSFRKTAFISQEEITFEVNSEINAKIGGIEDSKDDMSQYSKADDALKSWLNKTNPKVKTGELNKKKGDIDELEVKIKNCTVIDNTMPSILENISKMEKEQKNKKTELDKLLEEQAKLDKIKEARNLNERYITIMDDFNDRNSALMECKQFFNGEVPDENEITSLSSEWNQKNQKSNDIKQKKVQVDFLTQQIEASKEKHNKPSVNGLAIGCIMVGIIVCILGFAISIIPLAIVGITISLIGAVIVITSKKTDKTSKSNELEDSEEEIKALTQAICKEKEEVAMIDDKIKAYLGLFSIDVDYDSYEEVSNQLMLIQRKCVEYNNCLNEYNKAKQAKDNFESSHNDISYKTEADNYDNIRDFDEINAEIKETNTEIELISNKLADEKKKLDELAINRDNLDNYKVELAELKNKYNELNNKYIIISQTRELLGKAKEKFTGKYTKPISDAFAKYNALLDSVTSKTYLFDANSVVTVQECGEQRDTKSLSKGYRDMTGLCYRMALLDAMYKAEKPVVVMDDPFVNLDKKKLEGAKKFMEEISKSYQVIYFTCHDSRMC